MHKSPHKATFAATPHGRGKIRIRPFYLIAVTLAGIFGAEVAIMLLLRRMPPMPASWEALLDAILLFIVIFPLLYVFVFRPMYRLIDQYGQALAEIKTLQGIIPICSECKKIRTGKQSWEQLENYISAHSEARFSHGLCAECIRKLYPEKADQILRQMNDTDS